jgi:hypothetical protein
MNAFAAAIADGREDDIHEIALDMAGVHQERGVR